MNLLHIKYAVEVAEAGSINKAAERLLIGQPNLSRAVKDLELSLGVKIFERSTKGMSLTPEGETFMKYARNILKQVDALEETFTKGFSARKRFSISVPRASYISEAFARFSTHLADEPEAEVFYKETDVSCAINNIMQEDYRLGIIRYADNYDKYYKSMLDEKNLNYEMITEFRYVLAMNKECPLATKKKITFADLTEFIEITHADSHVPSLPLSAAKKTELPDNIRRKIIIFERSSQFEILSANPRTFMWVSPTPSGLLERYGLVQKICSENKRVYKDILIHRKDYEFSKLDHLFIEELIKTKREVIEKREA